ncbi:nuclear pore complex protein Nup98-Nup96 [Scaptodrosophila lebanonensis]|uniref:Nuclear pore complex protein Nup98-Nup96 n=1 Tax=Drosophila lebanonensis TaxID=7225 RepID=A0A6J2T1X3_DROLE|nr:nuclear pore complex protein Nup98-Nup96 [Scaptodrosophila lebanonensis]
MFGGTKPTFGAGASNTGFGTFSNTPTTFGQSAFGKPATPAFGAAPAFGAQPAQPSMFGTTATATQPAGGLFGNPTTSGAFGSNTTTAAPTTFGAGFSQPQQNSNIFGAAQNTTNTSLFGQAAAPALFGAAKPTGLGLPAFGQTAAAQPPQSLFGQPPASTSTSGFGTFGQAAPTTTNVFGSGTASAFGQPQSAVGASTVNSGSSLVKYQPTIGTDTLMKGGQPNNVNTKQHCITAMKEYEQKSLEELRMEDYLSGRKGPQGGAAPGGFGSFGATAAAQPASSGLFGASAQPSTGLFGQTACTENKSLFGASTFAQPAGASAFGAPAQQNTFMQKPFGATTTTGFGAPTADNSNPFGAKPAFGQSTGLFGQAPATSAAPAFGQTNTGFGGFGSTAGTQQNTLFGATNPTDPNKPAFGIGSAAPATSTGFGGFGATATSTAGGGLFGAKPATSFATPAFGTTSTANTGFGNFSMNNAAPGGGGLFNSNLNKPATSGFGGFGTQQPAQPLNFNAGNTGGSLFGNANKPGGLFGGTGTLGAGTATGGGLFGSSTGGFGTGNTLGNAFGTIGGNTALSGLASAQMQQQATVPIHKQILAKVTSPYGDTPIFKDLRRDDTDAIRATNPAAQQAVLDLNTNQFKIDTKSTSNVVKIKSLGNSLHRKSLFDGLEEFDGSVEGFNLKPNVKRLIIKPKPKITPGAVDSVISSNSNNNTPIASRSKPNTPSKDSFNSVIPVEPVNSSPGTGSQQIANKENDSSRRESWLQVRQHNLQVGLDNASPLNSTLTELVPRKPIETYRPSAVTRVSVSTIPENPFEDQSSVIARLDTASFSTEQANESLFSNRSYGQEERLAIEPTDAECEPHPTGIILRRVGYYTIPSLEELKSFLAEDGSCVVPNFTIGREGYGNVYFGKEMDVSGINLDEIVHFRNKEIIIYPDDDNKPPFGSGLNREAQVTLDQVWPLDKTKHEPIKDSQRLIEMNWEGKLRRVCDKNETDFIEYRPETGSWVFRVKHFSKYGLDGEDIEDGEVPTDPKKAKMSAQTGAIAPPGDKMTLSSLRQAQKISEEAARAMDPKTLGAGIASSFRPMDDSAEFMLMNKTQFFQGNGYGDSSLFAMPRSATSPTAALAKEVDGNEPHKMQLMKSSLFFGDIGREEDTESTAFPTTFRNQDYYQHDAPMWEDGVASDSSSQFDFGRNSPPLPVSSSASVASILREVESEESSSIADESICQETAKREVDTSKPFTFILKPNLAPVKIIASMVPLKRSLVYAMRHNWIADLGFTLGHSFKLSFGTGSALIVPNTYNNLRSAKESNDLCVPGSLICQPRGNNDFSPTILQVVQLNTGNSYNNFKPSIVPHLEVELRYCISNEVEGSECPWLQSDAGTDLIAKHLDEAIKLKNAGEMETYAVSVWLLLYALWGAQEELSGYESSSHYVVMCRRNLMSEWLENTLATKDMYSKKTTSNSYLANMLDLLYCHRVTEACDLAFNYDDGFLALTLSQLSSGPVVRLLLEEQLHAWQKSKSDKYITIERLKMFMLAAGVPLMHSSHGPINMLEDSNWITVLALQLWYFTAPTSSITDALIEYDKAFNADECYANPPTPAYEGLSNTSSNPVYDLRYHLLQLYSHRLHPLESLLNPITHTRDHMDFRLSWLLLQTLEALGYNHCGSWSEAQLHVDFANQLESDGLWEWSTFVLLHIKEQNQRESAVKNMLQRHVSVSEEIALTEQENFVIHRLGVPEHWVNFAKALQAGYSGQRHLQAKYLLRAKEWAMAHEIIYLHIAPDAIINNDTDYLHDLLTQFECTDEGSIVKVPNWANEGQIFLDFIDISAKFEQIRSMNNVEDIQARWEGLKPQLSDLCSRINALPCPTTKHRLCQSEISQSLSCLVHGMCIVNPELDPCFIMKMALERLPLPQEFATKDLDTLLDKYMDKLNHETTLNEIDGSIRMIEA